MKITVLTQIRVIEAATGFQFQNDFNSATQELANRGLSYRVEINHAAGSHCAYIFYDEEIKIAETIAEECRLAGMEYNCISCPDYQLPEDRRRAESFCQIRGSFTKADRSCCDSFYSRLLSGEITPNTVDVKYRQR